MLFRIILNYRKRERGSGQRTIEQLRKAGQQNQGLECKVWRGIQRKIESK